MPFFLELSRDSENNKNIAAEKKKNTKNPLYKDVEFLVFFFFSDYNKSQNF